MNESCEATSEAANSQMGDLMLPITLMIQLNKY